VGHGPQAAREFTGHGDGDERRLCAAGPQGAGALAQPDVGVPAEVLDQLGWLCEAQGPMTAALGARAGGPGASHKRSSGLDVPSVGARALGASRPGGRGRRDQPQAWQPFAWGITPGQGAHGGAPGDGHRAWPATERLAGVAHRVPTLGVPVLVELLGEPLAACSVCGDRTALCLEDDGRGRRRADDLGEPPEMGRAPMGPADGAANGAAQAGVEAPLGVLALAVGSCTGAGERAQRCLGPGGARHDRESPRACQPCQGPGVSAVGCAAVTSLVGHTCRGHTLALPRQLLGLYAP
jgi:hypothetical protein